MGRDTPGARSGRSISINPCVPPRACAFVACVFLRINHRTASLKRKHCENGIHSSQYLCMFLCDTQYHYKRSYVAERRQTRTKRLYYWTLLLHLSASVDFRQIFSDLCSSKPIPLPPDSTPTPWQLLQAHPSPKFATKLSLRQLLPALTSLYGVVFTPLHYI